MINLSDYEGKIIPDNVLRALQREWKKKTLDELLSYASINDWNMFTDRASRYPELFHETFKFFDKIPDELKYEFAVEAYAHRGDKLPIVRMAVRKLRFCKNKPELPEEIRNADYVNIYRAGEESLGLSKFRISWTTDLEVAKFFLYDYAKSHASYLYCGKIKPSNIIAYTDDREEKEVLQYGSVYDITCMDVYHR